MTSIDLDSAGGGGVEPAPDRILAMPPEWARHERTLMAWPARADLWGPLLDSAKEEFAATANAIAAFEPVLMVARPGEGTEVRRLCTDQVAVVEMPIDDSWLRDSGPIVVADGATRVAVDFAFNAWGGKFFPYHRDKKIAARLAEHLGLDRRSSTMVLEGGSIAVDGKGTLLTTEQCLLNPNRNPTIDKGTIEVELMSQLGVHRIVWLGKGLVEDRDTDGHVDLIAAFLPSGEVLLQDVPAVNPNFAGCRENAERLSIAGLRVRTMPYLAYAECGGAEVAVSYMNHYVCNGGVVVPLVGGHSDRDALEVIAACYPDHEVVGVPGVTLAYGGGGPHCITQQVPAL